MDPKPRIADQTVRAGQGDLTVSIMRLASNDPFDFDIVAVSMVLHHIDESEKLLPKLLARLNEGGSLLVIDWTSEHYGVPEKTSLAHGHEHTHNDSRTIVSNHLAAHTISRLGFDEDEMVDMMENAGFIQVEYRLYGERSNMGKEIGGERQMFFARGKRPVSK
ncbi:hypothetical protein V500_06147 [Pseudogymnoascus sp. VKM F-4518 (FW-2643)]|nr:hypothetical protein V500_06147 [Pseudogymnoascus sp. VKM F-4518 (FW-2643)]